MLSERGLRELGYVEGKNILLDVRSSGGDNERLPGLATELVDLKPVVIVSNGGFSDPRGEECSRFHPDRDGGN